MLEHGWHIHRPVALKEEELAHGIFSMFPKDNDNARIIMNYIA